MKESTQSAADAGGVVGPDVVAACALSAIPGVGASVMARITGAFGGFAAALEAGPGKILKRADELQLKQESVEFLSRKPDLEDLGAWAIAAAKGAGARVVVLGDPWYPPLLRSIDNPPPLLYVRGALDPDVPRIALVGARDADDYGLQLARDIAEGLAMAGVEVVSGGARGIDAAAHAGALWGQGTTAAVLGCGIDIVYPPENAALFDRLSNGGGAVVSEFVPGTPSARQNFPRRNRTISGLASAVVVLRATVESGSLLTANHAAAQGRPIFAVPGKADEPLSAGPNSLLTLNAARAVTSARDILLALGWPLPETMGEQRPAPRPRKTPPPSQLAHTAEVEAAKSGEILLDEVSLKVWNLLDERAPLHVDELAGRANLTVPETLHRLVELEQKGLCTQRPGKYFLRRGT
ncbi:MAG: DNA-protecting protein DprA [Deltaproteobacteria bacterium]|nr:DNA-protecting protein DprA [Deltaproteobacteria bacterium]